ncbi:Hypothetical protein AT6N2_L0310 [Agrobacterium tumefaciens]|nr:Hypothetical protein AT6N2_L0310 [Agrobacterium tumefaciens]
MDSESPHSTPICLKKIVEPFGSLKGSLFDRAVIARLYRWSAIVYLRSLPRPVVLTTMIQA